MSVQFVPLEKACKKCHVVKSIHEYYAHKATTDGHSGSCKTCENTATRAYYLKNQEKYREQHRRYYNQNKTTFTRLNRESHFRRYFGITVDQYEAMLSAQGGVCAICGGTNRDGRNLAVDHDHATGDIRGLLCGSCNPSLGKMKDSPELLRKAALYIETKGKWK